MALSFDEIWCYNGQLIVSEPFTTPKALGVGWGKIKHSVYIQGPLQVGQAGSYSKADATVMIGPNGTVSTKDSLYIKGDKTHEGDTLHKGNTVHRGDKTHHGNLKVSNLISCTGQGCAWTGSTINVQGWKGFDIKHPSKEGHRLRHICLEGPEGAIYYRGRTTKNTIALPPYWKDLVDETTISVQIQPIGAHQDIIVKRWDDEFIYLQAQGALPINAFFVVFAARADGERLIPEYEGESPEDYPGDNKQYSIAGYHYDRRTL